MKPPACLDGRDPVSLAGRLPIAYHGLVKRTRLLVIAGAAVVLLIGIVWFLWPAKHVTGSPVASTAPPAAKAAPSVSPDTAPTRIYAHNLLLRKGPDFRVYIQWLRGEMTRAHKNIDPSFDDTESFLLNVKTGVLRANVSDISKLLNTGAIANSPLKNITLSGNGNQIKLSGTLHKVIPLPIEMTGTIAAAPDNLIQVHVTKLDILKIPLKGLLGGFHVKIADLFHPQPISGIRVSDNDIFFDTQKLLPPPHILGNLTKVLIVDNNLEEIYGSAENDVARVEQWRNFLRLHGGTIDFGKLTMHHVDLIMIDISNDAWFDLDLAHYQDQLVNGYTRMTPQAGLQIFMPDVDDLPHSKVAQNISIEWLKDRNEAPPPDVTEK